MLKTIKHCLTVAVAAAALSVHAQPLDGPLRIVVGYAPAAPATGSPASWPTSYRPNSACR